MAQPEQTGPPVVRISRLTPTDAAAARETFLMMNSVFETEGEPLGDAHLTRLLASDAFWALAAYVDGRVVGGLTALTLPMTRSESAEIFIYDLAVVPEYQRQGIGRQLVSTLRAEAAARGVDVAFVPADNEDTHALDFYRAIGGAPAPVTIFTFGADAD